MRSLHPSAKQDKNDNAEERNQDVDADCSYDFRDRHGVFTARTKGFADHLEMSCRHSAQF